MGELSCIEEYRYLWDGSQPGWSLLRISGQRIELTLKFASTGPSARELIAIRKVVDDYRAMPLGDVAARLAGQQLLSLGKFEAGEARITLQACNDAGLTVVQQVNDLPRYVLTNELTKRALVIEDDELARQVINAALQNKVPVRHIEC